MIISLTVITTCILVGVIIIVCCFVSSCPLYDTCAGSWGKGETVQGRKEESRKFSTQLFIIDLT
jgi:hypothetical protein